MKLFIMRYISKNALLFGLEMTISDSETQPGKYDNARLLSNIFAVTIKSIISTHLLLHLAHGYVYYLNTYKECTIFI